jgi:PilS N terminal
MYYPKKVVHRLGFTALELIIVLVVGFSIIALSASKMGQLFSASSTTAALGTILELFTSARSLRGAENYGDQDADLMPALVKAQMIPKTLVIKGGTALNEWQGPITIKPSEQDGIGFDLSYGQVPGDACAKIGQNLLRSGTFVAIMIGAVKAQVDTPALEVVDACGGEKGKEKEGVTMIFQFRE